MMQLDFLIQTCAKSVLNTQIMEKVCFANGKREEMRGVQYSPCFVPDNHNPTKLSIIYGSTDWDTPPPLIVMALV